MRGSLALSRPHRVSFPARCGRVASSRDRGRRLVRHGSTDVGQPAFGAARHAKSTSTFCSLAVLFALEWCAQSPTACRAPGELTHTQKHTYTHRSIRAGCAHRRTLDPTDRMRARGARRQDGPFAAHRRHRACTLRPFEPARRGVPPHQPDVSLYRDAFGAPLPACPRTRPCRAWLLELAGIGEVFLDVHLHDARP